MRQGIVGNGERYKEFLIWRENDEKAWLNLGIPYYEAESYQESLNAILKALKLDDSHTYPYYFMGQDLENKNQFNSAISAYKKVLGLGSSLVDTYSNLKNLLSQQGKFDRAEATYQITIELAPR